MKRFVGLQADLRLVVSGVFVCRSSSSYTELGVAACVHHCKLQG